jgi:hypothetical protein
MGGENYKTLYSVFSQKMKRHHQIDDGPSDCHNEEDPLTFTPIKELEPNQVFHLRVHNKTYCFDIDALIHWIIVSPRNPMTNEPFSDAEIASIVTAGAVRLQHLKRNVGDHELEILSSSYYLSPKELFDALNWGQVLPRLSTMGIVAKMMHGLDYKAMSRLYRNGDAVWATIFRSSVPFWKAIMAIDRTPDVLCVFLNPDEAIPPDNQIIQVGLNKLTIRDRMRVGIVLGDRHVDYSIGTVSAKFFAEDIFDMFDMIGPEEIMLWTRSRYSIGDKHTFGGPGYPPLINDATVQLLHAELLRLSYDPLARSEEDIILEYDSYAPTLLFAPDLLIPGWEYTDEYLNREYPGIWDNYLTAANESNIQMSIDGITFGAEPINTNTFERMHYAILDYIQDDRYVLPPDWGPPVTVVIKIQLTPRVY